jgi:hypothetical protein
MGSVSYGTRRPTQGSKSNSETVQTHRSTQGHGTDEPQRIRGDNKLSTHGMTPKDIQAHSTDPEECHPPAMKAASLVNRNCPQAHANGMLQVWEHHQPPAPACRSGSGQAAPGLRPPTPTCLASSHRQPPSLPEPFPVHKCPTRQAKDTWTQQRKGAAMAIRFSPLSTAASCVFSITAELTSKQRQPKESNKRLHP